MGAWKSRFTLQGSKAFKEAGIQEEFPNGLRDDIRNWKDPNSNPTRSLPRPWDLTLWSSQWPLGRQVSEFAPPPSAPTMAQSGQRAAKQHLKYPRSHSLKKKLTFLHQKLCQLKQSITDNWKWGTVNIFKIFLYSSKGLSI